MLAATAVCLLVVVLLAVAIVVLTPRRWDKTPPDFALEKPAVGETAPDFDLRDPDSQPFHLTAETTQHPVVIEFGSFT